MANILLVDDEPGVRQLLRRCMEGLSHEIHEAESADAALAVMADVPMAVVFCDIQMPGKDGLWLTTEIRKRHPLASVVLATSVSTVPARISLQSGVLAYLVKPFNREAVREAVAIALGWHATASTAAPRAQDADWLSRWLTSLE
jgi:DNA-binding NtrC family response regulator